MKNYEVKIMVKKHGRKAARLGLYDVEASSEKVALEIAAAAGKKHYKNVCQENGIPYDETTQIWAELAEEE